MCSAVQNKCLEEPRAIQRVVRFIDALGCREIAVKSDTEPATIAIRNRVAAGCRAEITTEDAVKGDQQPNRFIENGVMQWRGIIRTITCHIESETFRQCCHGWRSVRVSERARW